VTNEGRLLMKVGMNQAPGPRGGTSAIVFYFLGGRVFHYTYMQRKKPQVSLTNSERGKQRSLQKVSMSSKTRPAHVSCSPTQSLACPLPPSKKVEQCSGPPNRRIGTFVLSAENLANETRNALRLQDPNRHARHNDEK